jgi:hypothetical protein
LTSPRITIAFHQFEKSSGVIQIHTGLEALPFEMSG